MFKKPKSLMSAAFAAVAGMFGFGASREQKKYEAAFGEKKTKTISIPLGIRRGLTLGGQRKTPFTRCELYGKKKGHSRGRSKAPKISLSNGIH